MNESSGASMPGSDAELLNAIRSGDPQPYDLLRARHAAAARRLAGHLVAGQAGADDVVDRAFAQVLDAISRGGGPTDAFRPYLLTAVRRTAHDQAGTGAQVPIDEQQIPDPGQLLAGQAAASPSAASPAAADPAAADLAGSPIVAAFLSLPERWRAVLWHTAVEGSTPAEAASLLGLPEAGAAELADQARDGLARAYRPAQPAAAGHDHAGPGVTASAVATDTADEATADAASAALRSTLAPLVLGEAAAAYLADSANSPGATRTPSPSANSAPAASWLPGRLRDSSARQRTVAVGAGALLAMAAIGGYALTLSPAPGGVTAASGHQTPAGATSRSRSATPSTSAPASSAPASASAPASSARAKTPAGSRSGPHSSHRPAAATAPGVSPTSARPLLPAPGPVLSPPSAAPLASQPSGAPGPWRPSIPGTAQIGAVGPAALNHVAAVNLGAAAIRLFSLVITGSVGCGRPVQVTVTAAAPSAQTIRCNGWRDPGTAGLSRHHEPGSRRATIAISANGDPSSSAVTRSRTEPGSGTGAAGGWRRGSWPPTTWQWPGAPWPGTQWPARPWSGHQWPTR